VLLEIKKEVCSRNTTVQPSGKGKVQYTVYVHRGKTDVQKEAKGLLVIDRDVHIVATLYSLSLRTKTIPLHRIYALVSF
jgi:hypothetical protein